MAVIVFVGVGNFGMLHSICVVAIRDQPMMCHSPQPQFQFHFYLLVFSNEYDSRVTVASLSIAIDRDLLI